MKRFVLLLTTVLLLCTGCSRTEVQARQRLQIVTTVFPAYDFAKTIAGEYADVTLLLSAGQEMHNYEPTPMDVAKIAGCDLFIRIGGESEVWTDTLLDAVDTSDMLIVTLMDAIEAPLEEDEKEHHHEHAHEAHEAEFDEHIWNSPVNAISMVNMVKNALSVRDMTHAEVYAERAQDYTKQLAELDAKFRALSEQTEEAVLVVADKFPFRYLAAEYGFHYAAAFSGCSSETEPTLHSLLTLTEECREHSLTTIFYLEFSSSKIADRVCDVTGARAVMLHPLHNVSAEDFRNGTSFLTLMQENYEAIKEALL